MKKDKKDIIFDLFCAEIFVSSALMFHGDPGLFVVIAAGIAMTMGVIGAILASR